jgi:hypothetical protein
VKRVNYRGPSINPAQQLVLFPLMIFPSVHSQEMRVESQDAQKWITFLRHGEVLQRPQILSVRLSVRLPRISLECPVLFHHRQGHWLPRLSASASTSASSYTTMSMETRDPESVTRFQR